MTSTDRDLRSFENLVRACDWEEIESWRSRVRAEHISALVALYDRVETWNERCAVLQLLQDKVHPEVRRRMHHFLGAPAKDGGENFALTKATALCHLENDFARFTSYYEDRARLAADVASWSAKAWPA